MYMHDIKHECILTIMTIKYLYKQYQSITVQTNLTLESCSLQQFYRCVYQSIVRRRETQLTM